MFFDPLGPTDFFIEENLYLSEQRFYSEFNFNTWTEFERYFSQFLDHRTLKAIVTIIGKSEFLRRNDESPLNLISMNFNKRYPLGLIKIMATDFEVNRILFVSTGYNVCHYFERKLQMEKEKFGIMLEVRYIDDDLIFKMEHQNMKFSITYGQKCGGKVKIFMTISIGHYIETGVTLNGKFIQFYFEIAVRYNFDIQRLILVQKRNEYETDEYY
jgi:hypothetical protein